MGGQEGVQTRLKQIQDAKKKFTKSGEVAYIPSISKTDTTSAMFGEYDYYLNAGRSAVPQWSANDHCNFCIQFYSLHKRQNVKQ